LKFESERAFKQLMERGFVATMRGYKKLGRVVIKHRGVVDGRGFVLGCLANTPDARRMLLPLSGFSSVEEWELEARRLHGRLPPFIVLVKRLRVRGDIGNETSLYVREN